MGGQKSANMALLGGLLVWPLSEYVFKLEAPYLASVAAAAFLFFLGSRGKHSFGE